MSIQRSVAALCLALAAALASAPAAAAGIGARIGTTGIGADLGFELVPTLSLRLGYSYLNYSTTLDDTDVTYDAKLKLSNPSLLLDFSPLPGPFRITGGLVFSDNGVNVTGKPTGGTFTFNGVTYPAAAVESLTGEVKAGSGLKPYLGIGYGNVAGFGVNFYFDLGVVFTGSPKATLNAVCGASLPSAQCAQLQSNVAAEAAELQKSVDKYRYYPVANIGVTIGF
jgi:hypothetical protein